MKLPSHRSGIVGCRSVTPPYSWQLSLRAPILACASMVVPAGANSSQSPASIIAAAKPASEGRAHSRNRSQLRKRPVDPEEEKGIQGAFTDVKAGGHLNQQISSSVKQYLQKYPQLVAITEQV